MANERIIQINGGVAITSLRSGDVMELDNSSAGSAQIAVTNVVGGQIIDYGTTTLSTLVSPYSNVYAINFNSTLSVKPTSIQVSVMTTSSSLSAVFANVITDTITYTNFQVLLSAPVPDGNHKLIWKAYA